jgi:hypothetical protein
MGRQTNFYMTIDDEIRFFEHLISSPDVIVFNGSRIPEPVVVPICTVEQFREADDFRVYIRNQSTSPAPQFMETKHGFWVESHEGEIVEWDRSEIRDGRLHRGRIYIGTVRVCPDDRDYLEWKSEEFRKWFGSLQRWIRRRAERCDDRWLQVMPGAAQFQRDGGYFAS